MIKQNVARILGTLPTGVELVAAAKSRSVVEVLEAVEAGIRIIGENYVQEAERVYPLVGNRVKLHFIGHLQSNKIKKAAWIFDMIETIDSVKIASEINKRCYLINKVMPVLIEINSGREKQKSGVLPEDAELLAKNIAPLNNIRVEGLMTMGPRSGDPEDARPYFTETKRIFDHIKHLAIDNIDMRYLSMGMTNSFEVAIEEGANIIRIGSMIFGKGI